MSFTAKVYRVLIASPSDVSEERELIPKVLHKWNTNNSAHYRIVFLPVKWETHTIPEMGERPQALINSQIVNSSDILIGTFWTKLGTHTGVAESGTVEEIQEFMNSSKKVMLYFSIKPVMPDSIEPEQYKKLKEFRIHCQSKGLYDTYDSSELLEEKLLNHLTLFAQSNSNEPISNDLITTNQLSVAFYHPKIQKAKNVFDLLKWNHLTTSEFINNQKEVLSQLTHELSTTKLPISAGRNSDKADFLNTPVSISSEEQQEYSALCEKYLGIKLDANFFSFGNLKKSSLQIPTYLGGSPSYEGTVEEREKYNLYTKFEKKLDELKGYLETFAYLENFNIAPLILVNSGQQFNESITVKLSFPKEVHILNYQNFEKPNYATIKTFTNDFLSAILQPKEDSNILEYYSKTQYSPSVSSAFANFSLHRSYKEEWDERKRNFEDKAEEILFFDLYENGEKQILKFQFDELNPSTSMWFPCYILFTSSNSLNIEYEITSKNLPQKLTGTLEYKL
ncbi:hypothetical protein MHB40_20260 [Lysinibacillus sp. FSL K6-0057]|uniref:hypothetical protein n=1 Tax=Lysinibacillus sp. FSL K6-0057 TaxID=2921411 RepID=UPI003159AE01